MRNAQKPDLRKIMKPEAPEPHWAESPFWRAVFPEAAAAYDMRRSPEPDPSRSEAKRGSTPQDGALAYAQGFGLDQNPFPARTVAWDRWRRDWRWQNETTPQRRAG